MTSPGTSWRDNAGPSLLDPDDPHGDPLPTPLDRRWLWRIEASLSGTGNEELRQLSHDLHQYLTETCEHHWLSYTASEDRHPDTGEIQDVIPAHSQCLWCSEVEWAEAL